MQSGSKESSSKAAPCSRHEAWSTPQDVRAVWRRQAFLQLFSGYVGSMAFDQYRRVPLAELPKLMP